MRMCRVVLVAACLIGFVHGGNALNSAEPKKPGRLLVLSRDASLRALPIVRVRGLVSVDPESGGFEQIAEPELIDGVLSSTGRYVAAGWPASMGEARRGVWIFDVAQKTPGKRILNKPWYSCCWANNDKDVIVSLLAGKAVFETYRVSADGKSTTRLPTADSEVIADCTRDGTWLLLNELKSRANRDNQCRLSLMHPDGSEKRVILNKPGRFVRFPRFSPDATKIVYGLDTGDRRQPNVSLWVADSLGKGEIRVPFEFAPDESARCVWSPDGLHLAVGLTKGKADDQEGRIVLIKVDGKQAQPVPLPISWNPVLLDWK